MSERAGNCPSRVQKQEEREGNRSHSARLQVPRLPHKHETRDRRKTDPRGSFIINQPKRRQGRRGTKRCSRTSHLISNGGLALQGQSYWKIWKKLFCLLPNSSSQQRMHGSATKTCRSSHLFHSVNSRDSSRPKRFRVTSYSPLSCFAFGYFCGAL